MATPSTLSSLMAAQASKTFWVVQPDGQTPTKSTAEVQALVDGGYDGLLCDTADADGGWKPAAAFNFAKVAPKAPVAPVAPAAPATPPPAIASSPAPAAAIPPKFATSTAVSTLGTPPPVTSRPLTKYAADATSALARLRQFSAPIEVPQLSQLMEDVDGGGMSHAFPFTQLRKGNWTEPKDTPNEIKVHLPAGSRPFSAILLGYRVGANGWPGDAAPGQKGAAPLFHYVLPSLMVAPEAVKATTDTFNVARNIQMTPKQFKSKFDKLGRLQVEAQILVWAPNLPLAVLTVGGFDTAKLTFDSCGEAAKKGLMLMPFTFSVEALNTHNKKMAARIAAGDPTANAQAVDWTTYWAKATPDVSVGGKTMKDAFEAYMGSEANVLTLGDAVENFLRGTDFDGLTLDQVNELLPKYDPLMIRA